MRDFLLSVLLLLVVICLSGLVLLSARVAQQQAVLTRLAAQEFGKE